MAMIFMSGAEANNNLEWSLYNFNRSNAHPRSGVYSWDDADGTYLHRIISPGLATAYQQFAWRMEVFGGAGVKKLYEWRNGATVLGTLAWDSGTKVLMLYTGNYASLVGTGTAMLSPNVWYVIEIYIDIADAGGRLIVRIDGLIDPGLNFTGDTKPGADAVFDRIVFTNPAVGWQGHLDDIILNDTLGGVNDTWPNGSKIVYLKPIAPGASTQWTASGGLLNWQCVDEVPPSVVDYVATNVAARQDTYELEDLPVDAASVQCVRADVWGMKVGVPAVNNISPMVRTGGADFYGTSRPAGFAIALIPHYFDQNPAGGNWDVPTVNALESGERADL